jgi:flagellar capping protein FliD
MIEDEENEVKKYKQKVDEMRNEKESLEKTNDLLNSQLTAMNSVILKLTNTNNALLNELNSLKKEKDKETF